MNNSINRPASVGRRFVGSLIDLFIIIFLTVMINSYIVTPLANNVVDLKVQETLCADYQEQYYKIADEYNIGTYERDGNEILFKYDEEFTKLSEEEQQKIVDEFNNDKDVKDITNKLNPIIRKLNNIYFFAVALSILLPELLIFLIIPLLLKGNATPGQAVMKLYTIHKGDFEARKFQIVLRFVTVFLIETLLIYYFSPTLAIILSPMISLIVMAISSSNSAIHDMLSSTKVVKNDAMIFKNYQEKNEYLNQKEKLKDVNKVYDVDTQELRDNFKFIDEQEERISNAPSEE